MIELTPADCHRAKPLFQVLDDHLAVQAILQGAVPAPVYIDQPRQPRVTLTWTGHRCYLAGSAPDKECIEALRRLLVGTIFPRARQEGRQVLVLYYAPDSWELELDRILQDRHTIKAQRHLYTIAESKHDWRARLPDGYSLRPVDRDLLHEGHLQNLDLLAEEMCSERPSVTDFLAKSFGVCAIHGDEIVGWCLSEYNTPSRCEVGIETLAVHRRRGLATAMASALIEQALSNGMTRVNWHCYARNKPSIATALSVGFEKVRDYPVIVVRLDGS